MPVPTEKNFTYGNILKQACLQFTYAKLEGKQGFCSLAKFSGFWDRPYINFTTAVAEGKTRWHVRSKTSASRAARLMF